MGEQICFEGREGAYCGDTEITERHREGGGERQREGGGSYRKKEQKLQTFLKRLYCFRVKRTPFQPPSSDENAAFSLQTEQSNKRGKIDCHEYTSFLCIP